MRCHVMIKKKTKKNGCTGASGCTNLKSDYSAAELRNRAEHSNVVNSAHSILSVTYMKMCGSF